MQCSPNQALNLVTHPPQRKIKEWEWNSVQPRYKQLLCLHGNLIHKYSLGYGKRGAGLGVLCYSFKSQWFLISSLQFMFVVMDVHVLSLQSRWRAKGEQRGNAGTVLLFQVTYLNAMVLLKIWLWFSLPLPGEVLVPAGVYKLQSSQFTFIYIALYTIQLIQCSFTVINRKIAESAYNRLIAESNLFSSVNVKLIDYGIISLQL